MYQPPITPVILLLLVLGPLITPHPCVEGTRIGYVHTKEPLLSGALGACDPSPNATSCVGGIASVSAFARRAVVDGDVDFVLLVPQIDIASAFTSMHPNNKGVNIDVFSRIHDQCALHNDSRVHMRAYVAEASVMASTKINVRSLRDLVIRPLSATIVPPATSPWRDVVSPVMYVNVNNGAEVSAYDLNSGLRGNSMLPVAAVLHVDDMSRVWTASTALSPLAAGVGGLPSGYEAIGRTSAASVLAETIRTARQVAGLVVLTSDDVAVTPEILLRDMLEYEMLYLDEHRDTSAGTTAYVVPNLLPDVFLLQRPRWGFRNMTQVTINATYTAENGTTMAAVRTVYVGAMGTSTGFMTLDLNETAVTMSVGLARSTAPNPAISGVSLYEFNPKTISNATKDALYFEDQAYLLGLSRVATSFDPVVGQTLEAMPAAYVGPAVYTCFGGECGQSSLVARALQWRFDADIAFINSGGVRGGGWAAGDVHMSDLFGMFPFSNNPCYGRILGLRIYQLFSYALSVSAFTTTYTASGADLLQAAGVRIEYVMDHDVGGIGAKILSFEVFNKTTSQYLPLDRLRYYTFASNDFLCGVHGVYSSMLSGNNAYRGESVIPRISSDTLVTVCADFLTAITPYTPITTNYYVPIPLSAVTSGSRSYLHFPTGAASCTTKQWYDAGVATCKDCPEGMHHSQADVSVCVTVASSLTSTSTALIIGLSVGGGLLLVLLLVLTILCEYRRRSGSRCNGNAPKGGADVAIVFTDIKSSTKLWGAVPMSMGVALDAHHLIIRGVVATHKGYEVKTVGDSFMIAIDDPQRAVDMAIGIQRALHPEDYIDDDPEEISGPTDGDPWNGLRVRIGIHYGPVEVILDEVTKGYDYYGPTVNVAARVEGVTDGGQLCVSEAVSSALSHAHPEYTINPMSKVELRGVKDEVQIHCIVPKGLESRVFETRLLLPGILSSRFTSGPDESDKYSAVHSNLSAVSHVPLNSQTRVIRDTVREAVRALSGDERIDVLERIRKAWRVQLPSNGPFKGITATDKKKKNIHIYTRQSSQQENKPRREGSVGFIRTGSGPPPMVTFPPDDTVSRMSVESDEENDEDVIFRVVAQRMAPRLLKPISHSFHTNSNRNEGSTIEMQEFRTQHNRIRYPSGESRLSIASGVMSASSRRIDTVDAGEFSILSHGGHDATSLRPRGSSLSPPESSGDGALSGSVLAISPTQRWSMY
jgi:class 3 adenylate cyclase